MSSKEDREVLQEVWSGRIPAMFTLSEEDYRDTSPDPCYLMLPRMSYLPLATEKVNTNRLSSLTLHEHCSLTGQEPLLLLPRWRWWRDVVLLQWVTSQVAPSHRSAA